MLCILNETQFWFCLCHFCSALPVILSNSWFSYIMYAIFAKNPYFYKFAKIIVDFSYFTYSIYFTHFTYTILTYVFGTYGTFMTNFKNSFMQLLVTPLSIFYLYSILKSLSIQVCNSLSRYFAYYLFQYKWKRAHPKAALPQFSQSYHNLYGLRHQNDYNNGIHPLFFFHI